jgi:PilZ domain
MPTPPEKRNAERQFLRRQCWIEAKVGAELIECLIRNVSEFGAKLICELPGDVPDSFVLNLTIDGKVKRKCKVTWRTDNEIGIAFLGRAKAPEGLADA